MHFLKGKKTYLVAIAIVALTGLKTLEVIDDETFKTIVALLGAGGLATMRAAVEKK